jgi:hypothetical protein
MNLLIELCFVTEMNLEMLCFVCNINIFFQTHVFLVVIVGHCNQANLCTEL